jgi:ubiquinone/menaquinone biosynthesis C-methylase UbiE
MEHEAAVQLIRPGIESTTRAQRWADLGAGEGTFTKALATMLSKHSVVYAVDKHIQALSTIEERFGEADIIKVEADFTASTLPFKNLDGILMANSIHYVNDKLSLLKALKTLLNENGRFVFVEYDTMKPNAWVPYPINFKALQSLGVAAGFASVSKLGELPSRYNNNNLYAALIT